MPGLIEEATIRRHHIYVGGKLERPLEVRCPDCGKNLFYVIERVDGCSKHLCTRCKDSRGNFKSWLFIFYGSWDDYYAAVRNESTTIQLRLVET